MCKWTFGTRVAKVPLTLLHCLDLSQANLSMVRSLSENRLPKETMATFQCADAGCTPWAVGDAAVDVVSCQLAFHYLCKAEENVRHFFAEAARVLTPTGLLLVSFADGRAVVRRARDSLPSDTVTSEFYTLVVPRETSAARTVSPFGLSYTFTMDGSVENVPEYLCHEGAVVAIAESFGFRQGQSWAFDELVRTVLLDPGLPRWNQLAHAMKGNGLGGPDVSHVLDTANLYRFTVFSQSIDTLRAFADATQS